MRYARAKWDEHQRHLAYCVYVTDSLYYQGQQKMLSMRWIDIVKPQKVDTRTADEIALDIIQKAHLKVD